MTKKKLTKKQEARSIVKSIRREYKKIDKLAERATDDHVKRDFKRAADHLKAATCFFISANYFDGTFICNE